MYMQMLRVGVMMFLLLGFVMSMAKDKAYYSNIPRVNFDLANAKKTDVIYKLFTNVNNRNATAGEVLTDETVGNHDIDRNIPTVIIFHGWTTDDTSPWYGPIRDAYFNSGHYNIIYINWSAAGNQSYSISSANVKPVGKFIAEFLVASGIPPHKIHLIGHSLGSHLTGFIGKSTYEITGKQIGRITALDPAGPSFERPEMREIERLSKDDATFVDVIHSDIGYYGYTKPVGRVDYYPNGGAHQPGCPTTDIDDNCSHARSVKYFIESINSEVKAKKATLKEETAEIKITVEEDGNEIVFGQHVDLSARGVYFFSTNSTMPFLRK